MTASRSGSTLLRFILDSHPDLACPPETMIGSTCGAALRLWESLEHAGDAERTDIHQALDVSADGLSTIRMAIDGAYSSYLKRRGKKRWCDKSLDTYQFADTVHKIFPDAKFICLVRHCMDVIASGARNCPWGVSRYGFDPYVAQYPGNTVAAIGAYWLACTQAILDFSEKNSDFCYIVRYEDMVTDPERVVASILDFIGASPAPGITDACFTLPHEGRGPGDEKIWFTSRVSAESMGQGVSVPSIALPPEMRTSINQVLTRLGYKLVDDDWQAAVGGIDPRADTAARPPATSDDRHAAELESTVRELRSKLLSASEVMSASVVSQWPSVAGVNVRLIAESLDGDHAEVVWRFPANGSGADLAPDSGIPQMVASAATWRSLLDGSANMVAEITDGRLRCFNPNDTHRIRSDEVHAIGAMLGLATVPVDHADGHRP